MKQKNIKNLLTTVFALLLALPTWAEGAWSVYKGTVSGGRLEFYSDAELTEWTEDFLAGDIVYIKALPDGVHTNIGVQFTAEKSLSSGAAQSRTRGIDMSETVAVTAIEGKPGVYSFVMPDGYNVTVSATFADKPTTDGVKYLDAEGEAQAKDGVYVLDGTEMKLGVDGKTTWYVAQGKLDYNDWLELCGNVHLILADGAKMTVETDEANAINAYDAQLFAIYAQSNNDNAGALTAISSGGSAIFAMGKDVIINGGYITAKCTSTSSEYENAGIIGNVTINGGHIVATSASPKGSGMFGQSITIGYNNPNTSLIVTGFNGNSEWASGLGRYVIVAEGKVIKYTDDNNEVHELSGTLATKGDDAVPLNKLIAGKTLRPATAYKLSVDNNLKAYLAEEIKEEYVYKDTKITLKPIAHYVLEAINNNGTALETTFADGVYSFDMPAADVTVSATAKKLLTCSDISIADIAAQTYTGSEIKPVVVKDGETDITDQCNIVYTNNTNVGTATATITAKAEGSYSGTVTKTFTISAKPLTITAEAKTKVYGAEDPALTYTVEGLIEGESLTGALTRAEGEDVGEYDITQGTLAASSNYSVTFVGAKLTITAATISGVNATDYSGTYDGAAHTIGVTFPEGATIMYGTAEGTYDKEAAPSYTNAGEYTVYYQVTKTNHNTVAGSAKITINKKALTITAEAKTKVYGTDDPALTYTTDGLIEGESLTGALTRAEGEDVGDYDITQGTLKASDNYSVTFVGAKLTITAANSPADPEPNTEVVNTEDPVTEGDETFYQPSQTVQDAISNNVNTGISFSAEASKDVKVNDNGGLEFGKSDKNVDVALTDMHKGETVTFSFEGSMQADASKLKEKGAAAGARRTRTEGKIDIVSGKEYEVLEDGNIVITVVLTEAAATINSITKAEASATGIEAVYSLQFTDDSLQFTVGKWYDLNGRPLQGKPTKKGVYIHNGCKTVMK